MKVRLPWVWAALLGCGGSPQQGGAACRELMEASETRSVMRLLESDPGGAIDLDAGPVQLEFGLSDGEAPGTQTLQFDTPPSAGELGEGAISFRCRRAPTALFVDGARNPISTFCGCTADAGHCIDFDVLRDGGWLRYDLSAAEGTVAVSKPAPGTPGTQAIEIDITDGGMTSTQGLGPASLVIDGLRLARTYVDNGPCPSGSDLGIRYTGWLPGGG